MKVQTGMASAYYALLHQRALLVTQGGDPCCVTVAHYGTGRH